MTSEKEILLGRIQELEEMQESLKVKIQAVKTIVEGLEFKEATLFDHVEVNPILQPVESATSANAETAEKPKVSRKRIKDGTMTASSMALHLSKELGMVITRESVIKVGKHCGAKPTYCAKQHISRYAPGDVTKIMNLYRTFNQI